MVEKIRDDVINNNDQHVITTHYLILSSAVLWISAFLSLHALMDINLTILNNNHDVYAIIYLLREMPMLLGVER